MTEKIHVIATGISGESPLRKIEVQVLLPRARMLRSFRILALLWGVALPTLFIPIVHFIAVPILLVLGPLLARRRYLSCHEVISGDVSCSECLKNFALPQRAVIWPMKTICPHCGAPIQVSLETQ